MIVKLNDLYIKDAAGRNPNPTQTWLDRHSGGGHPPTPTTPGSVHNDSSWLR